MDFEKQLEKIVHRCQDGERAAFEELFEMYQPRLKYYVRRLDSEGTNIDDILQDIWLTVFKKIHKLKDAQIFAVWLYRIARSKVYDGFRRKDRFVRLPQEDDFPVSGDDEPAFNANDCHRCILVCSLIAVAELAIIVISPGPYVMISVNS